MIKTITVINHLGDSLTIDLFNPWASGLIIEKIEGLGPPKATIKTTAIATMDGDLFNSSRATSRDISIDFRFLFDPDIETVRQRTYKYFPIKRQVTLIIETDSRTLATYGYVETNVPTIFSENEGCRISLICPEAYLYAYGDEGIQSLAFSSIELNFEFEFEDPNQESPTLLMSEVALRKERVFFYDGDAEAGVIILIDAVGPATNIRIMDTVQRKIMPIDTTKLPDGVLKAGDRLIINTNPGEKAVTLLRAGVLTNVLSALGRNSDWISVSKGDNRFAYTADTGETNLNITIESRLLYEGI